MPAVDHDGQGRTQGDIIEAVIKIALLALLAYAFWAVISPFLTIGIWSAIIAVALHPVFCRLAARIGQRAAALFITIAGIAVVLGPLTWLGYGMMNGIEYIVDGLQSGRPLVPVPPESVKSWPFLGEKIYLWWTLGATNAKAVLAEVGPKLRPVAPQLLSVARNVMLGLIQFLAAIVIAGFLFAPGPRIVDNVSRVLDRLLKPRGREVVRLIGATIRNVSRGVVGVAVLQSALAGLGFLMVGVPAAGVLTFVTLMLGILQIGPALVILPVVFWAWGELGTAGAALFTVYMVAVGLVDNVLRPIVMAQGLSTPMPVILIGVIGGTISKGIMGLFLGPIVVAVSWQLLLVWLDAENERNPRT